MAKKQERPAQHPDDFMVVTLSLDFQAKLNPEADDPQQLESIGLQYSMPAAEAVDYLESVVRAIREKRLYGFMVQDSAECAVGAGEWIGKQSKKYSRKKELSEKQKINEKPQNAARLGCNEFPRPDAR